MRIPCKIHDSWLCWCTDDIICDCCGEVIDDRHYYFLDNDHGPYCRECFCEFSDRC